MSETTTETTPAAAPAPTEGQEAEAKTFTQEDVDKIIQTRLAKFADHGELSKKAAEYDKLVEAQKSEAQKQTEALAALTAKNQALEADALRRTVADAKGLPGTLAKNLVGSTQAELETSADELLAALNPKQDEQAKQKPVVPHVATEGKTPRGTAGGSGARFEEFLNSIRK